MKSTAKRSAVPGESKIGAGAVKQQSKVSARQTRGTCIVNTLQVHQLQTAQVSRKQFCTSTKTVNVNHIN